MLVCDSSASLLVDELTESYRDRSKIIEPNDEGKSVSLFVSISRLNKGELTMAVDNKIF